MGHKAYVNLFLLAIAAVEAQLEFQCTFCQDYGGIRDPRQRIFGGHTCAVDAFFASLEHTNPETCDDLFLETSVPFCCNDPPPVGCPICGTNEMPNPDRALPRTGLTCRDLAVYVSSEAAFSGLSSACSELQREFGEFCCNEAIPEYCSLCEDTDGEVSSSSCFDATISVLQASTTSQTCEEIRNSVGTPTSCCEARPRCPNFCNGRNFLPDNVVHSLLITDESKENLPTCADALDALAIDDECDADDAGIALGCCEGASECTVCGASGGAISNPNKPTNFVSPGTTCGTLAPVLAFVGIDACNEEAFGTNLAAYCGCTGTPVAPSSSCLLCGGDVKDPSKVINSSGATCGEMLEASRFSAEICSSQDIHSACCDDPFNSPSVGTFPDASSRASFVTTPVCLAAILFTSAPLGFLY